MLVFQFLIDEFGWDQDEIEIVFFGGNAREYAMKKLGHKRLVGDNIETWTLAPSDLDAISAGLWDAYPDEFNQGDTFNIEVSCWMPSESVITHPACFMYL